MSRAMMMPPLGRRGLSILLPSLLVVFWAVATAAAAAAAAEAQQERARAERFQASSPPPVQRTKVPYTPLASPSRRSRPSTAPGPAERLEKEYLTLLADTEDKDSLEAIRDLHRQLDNDKDGTIEPAETGEFMRGDLYQAAGTDSRRGRRFHDKDAEITVKDLWVTWRHSEVFNWTDAQIGEWVTRNVELPQYAALFLKAGINGTHLPKVAASPHFLSKVVGISSPIHRSKLTLKAMDLVLFGPPRDHNTFWKDTILTSLLLLAVTCLFYAYHQNKRSKGQLKKMMADLDSLAKAEETLQELQEKLQQKDSKIESLSSTPSDVPDAVEINRLREELDMLRSELQRAEVELEDRCWVAPPVLQHWLQLTYEMESAVYNAKKKTAEEQLEMAKDMCEKLKRKRSSLVGAFVSTHGRSIDDVDRSILDAKTALMELTRDLTERSQRWRQIEMLCGCSIVNNPGISVLQGLVRHVGVGRGASTGLSHRGVGSSRMSRSGSQEDLLMDEMDSHSVASHSIAGHSIAASSQVTASVVSSQAAKLASSSASHYAGSLSGQLRRRGGGGDHVKAMMLRESSKESSSSSDEMPPSSSLHSAARALPPSSSSTTPASPQLPLHHHHHHPQSQLARASTPPASSLAKTSSPLLAAKRSRMVKSFSQDAGGSIQSAAASAAAAVVDGPASAASAAPSSLPPHPSSPAGSGGSTMTQSVSEGQLQRHQHLRLEGSSVGSALSSMAGGMASSSSRPSVLAEEGEGDLSCSASESGSLADLPGLTRGGKVKESKKRSFFHFRKKKEKKDLM